MNTNQQNTLKVAVGVSRTLHKSQNDGSGHQHQQTRQLAQQSKMLSSKPTGATMIATSGQSHLGSSAIIKVLPSQGTVANQASSTSNVPCVSPVADLSPSLPQLRARPISNKRSSLRSTIQSVSPTVNTEADHPQFKQSNASFPINSQYISLMHPTHNARNLPNKVSSTTSTSQSNNHSFGVVGDTASSNQLRQLAQTNSGAAVQGGGYNALNTFSGGQEMAAYADGLNERDAASISTSQLSLGQHYSRTQIASQLSAQVNKHGQQQKNQQHIAQSVRATSFQEQCAQLSPSAQNQTLLMQQSTTTRSNFEISTAVQAHQGYAPGGPYSSAAIGDGWIPEAPYGGDQPPCQQYPGCALPQSQESSRRAIPQTQEENWSSKLQQRGSDGGPRRNLENKVQRSSERVAFLKQKQPQQDNASMFESGAPSSLTSVNLAEANSQHTLKRKPHKNSNEPLMSSLESQKQKNYQRDDDGIKADQSAIVEELGLMGRYKDDCTIMDFVDASKILLGRIGIYKINFNKNLRRFQDIAQQAARQQPAVTVLANQLLRETCLPSVWSVHQFQKGAAASNAVPQDANSSYAEFVTSPQRADEPFSAITSAPPSTFFGLNSQALPLKVNFNPLMVTYSLFLRTMVEQVSDDGLVGLIVYNCQLMAKKIVSKLYQIQIKAVNFALQNLVMDGAPMEQYPAKVIEFIKRWVAKEKMLIAHSVKQVVEQAIEMGHMLTTTPSEQAMNEDFEPAGEGKRKNTKDLVAKKNKKKLESRVLQSRRKGPTLHFSNLNSSKESDDFMEQRTPKQGSILELGGLTQDNFYKVSPEIHHGKLPDEQLKAPQPRNFAPKEQLVHTTKSLQQKVNSRHREAQHRNLFVEYHQIGNQKQAIFHEPQLALSSTNFNKNHSNSLIQIKMQQQQHQHQMGEHSGQPRPGGITSDVYGDWKQKKTSVGHAQAHDKNSSHAMGVPEKQQHSSNAHQVSNKELNSDFSHRTNVNRSLSPSQFQVASAQQQYYERSLQQQFGPDEHLSKVKGYQEQLVGLGSAGAHGAISGAQTVTSGFFNPQKNHHSSNKNLRKLNAHHANDLGHQNLSNFQWPRHTQNSQEHLLLSGKVHPGVANVVRPQTRDSYFEGQGSGG